MPDVKYITCPHCKEFGARSKPNGTFWCPNCQVRTYSIQGVYPGGEPLGPCAHCCEEGQIGTLVENKQYRFEMPEELKPLYLKVKRYCLNCGAHGSWVTLDIDTFESHPEAPSLEANRGWNNRKSEALLLLKVEALELQQRQLLKVVHIAKTIAELYGEEIGIPIAGLFLALREADIQ